MNLYPLDLVLASSLAWATIFLGALPNRLLRQAVFTRLVAVSAGAWFVVALIVSASVVHYYILLAALCFYAWWQFRHDYALSGKGWLMAASGLGISLGVVLILATTPQANPPGLSPAGRFASLAAVYLAGAIVGGSTALYFFTRRKATLADYPTASLRGAANLLLALVSLRAFGCALGCLSAGLGDPLFTMAGPVSGPIFSTWAKVALVAGVVLVSPIAAARARQLSFSPVPSRSGPAWLAIAMLGLGSEIFFRLSLSVFPR